MKLVHSDTGAILTVGSQVMAQGASGVLEGFREPAHPGSTGRVYVKCAGSHYQNEWFPSVINAEFIPDNAAFLSRFLRNEIIHRMRAMLEECSEAPAPEDILDFAIGSLSETSKAEWDRVNKEAGSEAAENAALSHIRLFS